MQENTESEKPEDSLDKEENLSGTEETAENLAKPDPEFEEQDGEVLPPEKKKKSGAGKVFLLLVLVLAGSGSYLYFNNLIPAEILNLVSQKSIPSKPLVLVTPTPPFMEETIAEIPESIVGPETVEPVPMSPEIRETHISGAPVDSVSPDHISGTDFDQTPEKKEVVAEKPQETVSLEEVELTLEQKIVEEVVTETIASPESDEPRRSKAVQAYLDFIESSVQKLGELIKEGLNWGWDYLTEKLG